MIDLTEEERQLIGFALSCYIEDGYKRFKGKYLAAVKQVELIEKITYTKIIPESWSGPKPESWN